MRLGTLAPATWVTMNGEGKPGKEVITAAQWLGGGNRGGPLSVTKFTNIGVFPTHLSG